jgi:hypothetical protein
MKPDGRKVIVETLDGESKEINIVDFYGLK